MIWLVFCLDAWNMSCVPTFFSWVYICQKILYSSHFFIKSDNTDPVNTCNKCFLVRLDFLYLLYVSSVCFSYCHSIKCSLLDDSTCFDCETPCLFTLYRWHLHILVIVLFWIKENTGELTISEEEQASVFIHHKFLGSVKVKHKCFLRTLRSLKFSLF